jgi:hypothetical protein
MKENVKDKQDHHFRFVRMGNLPALLPNATPLVMRFFAEMSKKRQRCAVVNLDFSKTTIIPSSVFVRSTSVISKFPKGN